jgi:formylglycine-generating enzyme required for sulfatase activity
MKLRFFILIVLLAVIGQSASTPSVGATRRVAPTFVLAAAAQPAGPQQAEKPLTKDQVMELVKAEMDNTQLAKLVRERGIDFEPTEDYVQALRQAGAQDVLIAALHALKPQPLTKEQVLHLVAGGVPSERAAALVKQRGIDFLADEQYLEMLRLAGANDTVLAAVREAGAAATAPLVVETSPNAEVFLDGELQGQANAQGELTMKAKLGAHALKVSLVGKKDFQQSITVVGGQATQIRAQLVDAPGSIRLRTLAGARISLDGASRGSANASGELVLADVPPGPHELRVSAPGRMDRLQMITITAGAETHVEAELGNILTAGPVRENPKDSLKYVWIPPGTFMMGCSPGDNECKADEKPSHRVVITKGFWLGQTEVTVSAYKRFAAATGRQMPPQPNLSGRPLNPGWGDEAMPMVDVTWDNARAYCGWAGGRLPTEAEWEYAARAGSTVARYGDLHEIAWYADNTGRQRVDTSMTNLTLYWQRLNENGNGMREVGQKRANGFGLFDMLGNVWEWVNDWYEQNYYQNSPSQDPAGPASGTERVLRGGSWGSPAGYLRVSHRRGYNPGSRNEFYGFRCGGEVFAP